MNYSFNEGEIISPLGIKNKFPTINIVDSSKYGEYFASEIFHLYRNLDYVKEIVLKLEEYSRYV